MDSAPITPSVIQNGMSADAFAAWVGVPADGGTASADADTEAPAATEDEAPADETDEDAEGTEPPEGDDGAGVDEDDASADDGPAPDAKPASKKSLPFTAVGKDGSELDADVLDGLTFTFKANGKDTTLSVADLVRRAASESGAMSHTRKVEGQLTSLKTELDDSKAQNDYLRDLARNAVLDDEYREKLRNDLEDYERPEAELARLRADREAESQGVETTKQGQARTAAAAAFFNGTVLPKVDALLKSNPTVSYEELLGRFSAETGGMLVNGVLPSGAYEDVETILTGALSQWVRKQHAARTSDTKARTVAQQAKNSKARAVKPGGSTARGESEGPRSKPNITSHKDAAAFAFAAFTE